MIFFINLLLKNHEAYLKMTRMIKTSPKTASPFYSGVSSESQIVENSVSRLDFSSLVKAEIQYLFDSSNIPEFESRADYLRDLLLRGSTAISEKEMNHIKTVFENIDRIIDSNNKIELCLLALTSVLEPLFKMPSYSNDVADIVRILLKNSYARLRYAALDIISFGLGTVLIADELLLEAAKVLSDKDFNYLKSKKLTTTFSSELYKISRSMTEEEYLFMRNMKLSKATSGIPNF